MRQLKVSVIQREVQEAVDDVDNAVTSRDAVTHQVESPSEIRVANINRSNFCQIMFIV